ncbi:TPA_asm: hypothetical protein G1Q02_17500 [Salmonella enterica subsp. enterica serovar Typhimurium]|nr:hypothetical protein [Salmonella enterica subsp. enterica serovar Typhimurium]
MGRLHLIKTNFTAGELSPRLAGRVDIDRYSNGAKRIENAICLVHGGVKRRNGTRFISSAKYHDKPCRLIPFSFNRGQTYILEFGDKYIRFFHDGQQLMSGGVPYEVTSPYTAEQIQDIKFAQGADTMFIVHPDVTPQRLQRHNQTSWTLENCPFIGKVPWTSPPSAVTLYQQRLIMAGGNGGPQTLWMSETGAYLNFEVPSDISSTTSTTTTTVEGNKSTMTTVTDNAKKDDSPAEFTVASDQMNPLLHIAQVNSLVLLTYGGEFTCSGGSGSAITPTSIDIKHPSSIGSYFVRPIRVSKDLVFVQRSGRKLYSATYDPDDLNGYQVTNLSLLSEHVLKSGVRDLTYQQEPESVVWAVCNSGECATLTVDKQQQVIAWARQITQGSFESIASVAEDAQDSVYCIVRRNINGNTVRYIEVFTDDLQTDATIIGNDPSGKSTWNGLSNLEGCIVDVVADGVVMSPQTVTSGEITLPRNATRVEIGLHYDTTIALLQPEIQSQAGTSQGTNTRINKMTLRLLETTGAEVNGNVIAFRTFGKNILNQPAPLFTGDHDIALTGWSQQDIVIQQRQPLPFHLLAVMFTFTSNGG